MSPVYEFYRGGRRVERVAPVAGDVEDLRIGGLVLDREAAGLRDGWYIDGTYQPEQSPAPAENSPEPVQPATTRRQRAPVTEEA